PPNHTDHHSLPTRRSSDLKTKADALKAQLRDATSGAAPAPAATASAPAPAPAAAEDPVAERAQKMKTLKTRYNSLHKLWKEANRSEEHTSELQSRENLVCR